MPTETRTFVGDTATPVGDGYVGLHLNRTYKLQVEWRDHDSVTIALERHEYVTPNVRSLVLTSAQFEKWFMK